MPAESKRKIFVFGSVFLCSFLAYLLTLGKYVYWQDSGYFLSVIKDFGIPCAPGFPLFLLLYKLSAIIFSDLIGFDFVMVVCATSAFFTSCACALISVTVYELFSSGFKFFQDKGTSSLNLEGITLSLISVFSGLSFGFGYYPWFQAVNAEIYSLCIFFLSLGFYLIVRLGQLGVLKRELTKPQWAHIILITVVTGFSCSTHPMMTVGLFVGAIFVAVLNPGVLKNWKFVISSVFIFTAAYIIPNLFQLYRSPLDVKFTQGNPSTLKTFIGYIFGTEWEGQFGWLDFRWERLISFGDLFYNQYFIVGMVVLVYGCCRVASFNRKFSLFCLVAFLAQFINTWSYSNGGEYDVWVNVNYMILSIPFAVGLYCIGSRLRAVTKINLNFISIIGLLNLLVLLFINFRQIDRKDYDYAERHGMNLIKNLDKNAIIVLAGETDKATVQFLQIVRKYRNDVSILMPNYLKWEWYHAFLQRIAGIDLPPIRMFEYEIEFVQQRYFNDIQLLMLTHIINFNADRRHIFLYNVPPVPIKKELRYLPAGAFLTIVPAESENVDLKYWEYSAVDEKVAVLRDNEKLHIQDERRVILGDGKPYYYIRRRAFILDYVRFYSDAYKNLGDWYITKGNGLALGNKLDEAKEFYQLALVEYKKLVEINPNHEDADVYFKMSMLYFNLDQYEDAQKWIIYYRKWYPLMFSEFKKRQEANLDNITRMQEEINKRLGN
ncbi:MAG: DUF2723 domain-containing protein [Planctomycetes bacterium]|nr:DUF2723 domain-containing protein [Planctomycetota bacterium]